MQCILTEKSSHNGTCTRDGCLLPNNEGSDLLKNITQGLMYDQQCKKEGRFLVKKVSIRMVCGLISLLLVFLLGAIFITSPAAAAPSFLTENRLTEQEAGTVAIIFIAGEVNNGSGWTQDTRISKITPLYSEILTPTAYAFELETNGEETGYVIISTLGGVNAIHEFAFSGRPIYYEVADGFDRVYLTAPLEYAVEVKGSVKGIDGRPIIRQLMKTKFVPNEEARAANKELLIAIKKRGLLNLDEWMVGYAGQISGQSGYGGIYDPYAYVNDRYGTGWTLKNSRTISGVPCYLQSNFEPNVANCTLSTLTMIFKYHQAYSGKTNIPSNQNTISNTIKDIAITHGYTPTGGTNPTKIDNIINDTWSHYGYSGYGWSYYTWTYSTFTTQVNNNRPSSINISSGYYASHSVALVGYRTYQKSLNPDKGFLKVHDNWTTAERYIDFACFVGTTLASLSVVFP
jgi:hypothetical protein